MPTNKYPVRILRKIDKSLLIEYRDDNGDFHRGTVPEEVIVDDKIDTKMVSLVIPFGVDWEYVLQGFVPDFTPAKIAQLMKNNGIWTMDDFYKNPKGVMGAINAAYNLDYGALVAQVNSYRKQEHGG